MSELYESRTNPFYNLRLDNHLYRTNTNIEHFGSDSMDYTNVEVSLCDLISRSFFVELFISTIDSSVKTRSVILFR